jgi:competence protein ComEA
MEGVQMKKTKAILTGALFFFTLCNYHVFAQDSAEPESAAAETSTSQQEAEGVLFEGQININTATVEEFKLLPAINQLEAENIVEYRTANGSFNAVDDLLKVRGIRRLEYLQFKDYLTLEGETTLRRK